MSQKIDWKNFVLDADLSACWWCGRTCYQTPDDWFAKFFIERAHIVSKPRVEDRRVAVLLCSRCHYATHNANVFGYHLPTVTLGHMLWLKRTFDRAYFDLEYMRLHSVGALPKCLLPPRVVMLEFASRQGGYPRAESLVSRPN